MPGEKKSFGSDSTTEIERLSFALRAAGVGTWDLDPIQQQVRWDDLCKELYGFFKEDIVAYEQVLTFVHPEDKQRVHEAVQWALNPSSGGVYDLRFRIIGAETGQLRWLYCKGMAYFNEQGQAYRFSGTAQDITRAVQDQEKIMISERIAQVALENSNSGYFRLSLRSNEIDYSPGFARILTGEEDQALTREDFVRHIHPEDWPVRLKAFEVATRTGKLDYEARTIWNDGSIHWMRAKATYLRDASGKHALLTGTVHDTTAEHLHQEAVKEAEDLLATAFSNASMGLAFTDLNGRFLKVNSAYTRLLDYTEEALYATTEQELTYPDDRARNAELFSELVSGKRHYFNLAKRYLRQDGSPRWVQLNLTRISGSTDKEGRLLAMTLDINSEIEGQQALAASEALFKNVTNSSPTGLWLSEENGNLTYLNKTLVEWTDMPYEALLGTGWTNAVLEEDRQRSAEIFRKAVAARAHYDVLFRLRKGDGRISWCRAAGDPYHREDGSYAGYAGFCMDIDELVAGREALQQSETKFRLLLEEAPVATCLFVDRDMKIEVANEKMIGFWGKARSVIGRPLAEAVPELKGQPFLQLLEEVFTTGKTYEARNSRAELEVNGVLGTYYFDFTYKPLRNADGEVYAIMAMAVDVTEQVQSRMKLEESELFSRNIIDHSPVAKAVFVGPNMVIRTVNENMLAMLGRDASIIGLPFMEAMPELIPTHLLEKLRHVLATGETYYQPEEKLELIKHGRPYTGYYNYIYKALRNTAGEYYGIITTATEVTEQVLARQKVEEAEGTLRGAIELAELGTWEINLVTGTLEYSERLRDWFGIGKSEVLTIERAYGPDRAADRALIKAALSHATNPNTDEVYDVEYTLDAAEAGRERIIHAQGKTFFNEKGEAYKVSGTVQDVTAQRRQQLALEQEVQQRTQQLQASIQDLQRSNQNLQQFAYIASHDLQEPLRKIQSFGDLLKTQYATELAEGVDYLERMQAAAGRMSILIRDLLTYSRISTRQDATAPVSLNGIVNTVLIDLELVIQEKAAVVEVAPLPTVQGDTLQLGQLFQNLLSNALKFQQPERKPFIGISTQRVAAADLPPSVKPTRPAAAYHRIDVSDNGIGFDDKYVDRIFQVFQRLHGRNEFVGTGIGLAICEKVAANHGGAITARSRPGQGATFSVYLPD